MNQKVIFLEDYAHPGRIATDGLRGGGLIDRPERGGNDQTPVDPATQEGASGASGEPVQADDSALYVVVGAPAVTQTGA
eukprot:5242027-Prorocentrum_lima.AAC.1